MSLAGVKAGDTVIITDVNQRGPRRETVKAVGRKYATIDGEKYDLATGVVNDGYRHRHAYTEAAWARRNVDVRLWAAASALPGAVRQAQSRMSDDAAAALLDELQALIARLG